MGTPAFAAPTLEALIAAGHHVVAVYTQPPRQAGRGRKERRSAVHEAAAAHDIPVHTPASLGLPEVQAEFAAHDADAAIVVAYGLLLPNEILKAPRLGCINLHASLLPRWRGAAPIQWTILSGDTEAGICAVMMDEGLDTGPVLASERISIGPLTTAGDLHDQLAALGAPLIASTLKGLADGSLQPVDQDEVGAVHARKIVPDDARLDWRRTAVELERVVRAMAPAPGAWFEHSGDRIKVSMAVVGPQSRAADSGTVVDRDLTIQCGVGSLRLVRLQRSGRKPMSATELLRGYPIKPGTVLPSPSHGR